MPSTSYRNVIVVDDEASIHDIFDLFLQPDETEIDGPSGEREVVDFADTRNFHVLHSESGSSAVQLAKSRCSGSHPIQVAFIDLKMEEIDGIETIKILQEADPRIIFAIVTGCPNEALELIADHLGLVPVEVIPKPFDGENVHQAAARMCSRWELLHGI